jgi:hypothetical protein
VSRACSLRLGPNSARATHTILMRVTTTRCDVARADWLAHHLAAAGLSFELLPECEYDFVHGSWPSSCGRPFHTVRTRV